LGAPLASYWAAWVGVWAGAARAWLCTIIYQGWINKHPQHPSNGIQDPAVPHRTTFTALQGLHKEHLDRFKVHAPGKFQALGILFPRLKLLESNQPARTVCEQAHAT